MKRCVGAACGVRDVFPAELANARLVVVSSDRLTLASPRRGPRPGHGSQNPATESASPGSSLHPSTVRRDERVRRNVDLVGNSPRTRRQKLHNNSVRSTTPIFLPILGLPPRFSSPLHSHRCGRFHGQKQGFSSRYCVKFCDKTR